MPNRFVRRGSAVLRPAPTLAVLGLLLAGCSGSEQAVGPRLSTTAAPSAESIPASASGVVISQVYGANGTTLSSDYVELHNSGQTTASLTGWSIQYGSATGTGNFAGNGVVALSGDLAPGQYYLVRLATTVGAGTAIPTADATGSINLSGSAGKVVLVKSTTGLACNGSSTPCSAAQLALIEDLVGYGTANFYEGSAAAPAASNTTAIFRKDDGCTDTGSNAADFLAAAPAPRNSTSPTKTCDAAPPAVVASVVVAPSPVTVSVGATTPLTATAKDANGQTVAGVAFTWSSSDETVATVNASGAVTGIKVGSATVTATAPNAVAGTTAVTVSDVPPPAASDVRVSEFHYDNDGTDAGEAIELEGDVGGSLAGWSLVLYTGSTGSANVGQSYQTIALSGTFQACTAGGTRGVLSFPAVGLQNGDKDGFALVNAAGQVVEFLSYEGTLTAVAGPAAGMTSTDVGVDEEPAPPSGLSLQRAGNGVWFGPATSTFGQCNAATPPAAPTGVVLEGYSFRGTAPIPVGFGELYRFKDITTGSYVRSGLTWTTSDASVATVDALGNVTARGTGTGTGTATITATETATGRTASTTVTTTTFSYSDLSVYADELQFGTPTDATPADDYLVNRETFASSWNATRGQPNWVAYNLEATHRIAVADRCDCFIMDPLLPTSFPLITTADYDGSGYSRGHMTMSADRQRGTLDNATTFYYSNIIPQTSQNNAGPWLALEQYLGDLAVNQNKEIFVFDGGAAYSGTLNNAGRVAIPTRTWKIAVILDRNEGLADVTSPADMQIIAVDMPNTTASLGDWTSYRTSVDAIEALTGYDFLSALPDNIECRVEQGVGTAVDNCVPEARLWTAGGTATVKAGGALVLNTAALDDAGDGPWRYQLDFGDGTSFAANLTSLPTVQRPLPRAKSWTTPGTYTVRLSITDKNGKRGESALQITVTP